MCMRSLGKLGCLLTTSIAGALPSSFDAMTSLFDQNDSFVQCRCEKKKAVGVVAVRTVETGGCSITCCRQQ